MSVEATAMAGGADNNADLYTLHDFQEHGLNHCRQAYEWITEDFEYTFATHKDNGKEVHLLEIAKKRRSKTKLAWAVPEDDRLQYYYGTFGNFDKTEHMLRPSSGYTSVCRPVAPFNYIFHETSPSPGPERHVMRRHAHLFVQVMNLFHHKTQGIKKVTGRDLLAEFEQVLNLMWTNKTAVDAETKAISSSGKRKTRDTDDEYAQDDSDESQVHEPKPSRKPYNITEPHLTPTNGLQSQSVAARQVALEELSST
jgi:hypothetical protein